MVADPLEGRTLARLIEVADDVAVQDRVKPLRGFEDRAQAVSRALVELDSWKASFAPGDGSPADLHSGELVEIAAEPVQNCTLAASDVEYGARGPLVPVQQFNVAVIAPGGSVCDVPGILRFRIELVEVAHDLHDAHPPQRVDQVQGHDQGVANQGSGRRGRTPPTSRSASAQRRVSGARRCGRRRTRPPSEPRHASAASTRS